MASEVAQEDSVYELVRKPGEPLLFCTNLYVIPSSVRFTCDRSHRLRISGSLFQKHLKVSLRDGEGPGPDHTGVAAARRHGPFHESVPALFSASRL